MKPIAIVLPFVAMLAVYVLLHFYIGVRSYQALELYPVTRKPALVLLIILGLSFFLSFALRSVLPTAIYDTIRIIGNFWLVFVILSLLALLLIDITRIINHFLHIYPSFITINYQKAKFITMITIIAAVTFSYILGYLNFTSPEVTELEVNVPKRTSITTGAADTLNILMISDLHLGYTVNKRKLKKYVEMINEQQPDIIFFVGDIIDMSIDPVLDQNMDEELSHISAKYGIYAVAGNHEYIGGEYNKKMQYYRAFGWNVLEDSTMLLNGKYYIVGRRDRSDKSRKTTAELVASLDKSKPIILLDHQPYNLEHSEEAGVDLHLSGHTHQGQFFPITLFTKAIYEIDYGYLKKGNTNVYVSSGLGLWGPPIRLGTNSEMVKIKLITE